MTRWGFGVDASTTFGGATIGAAVARGTRGGTGVDNIDFDDEYTLSTFGYVTIPVMEDDAIGAAVGYTMLSFDKSDDEAKIWKAISSIFTNCRWKG